MQQDADIYHGLGGHYLQSSLRWRTTNKNNNNNQNNISTKQEKKTNKRRRRPQEYYCHLPLHYISSQLLESDSEPAGLAEPESDNKESKKKEKGEKNQYLIDGRHLHGMRVCFRELQFFFLQKINPSEMQQNCVSERASERARSSSSGKVISFLRSRNKICATGEEGAAAAARAKPAREWRRSCFAL